MEAREWLSAYKTEGKRSLLSIVLGRWPCLQGTAVFWLLEARESNFLLFKLHCVCQFVSQSPEINPGSVIRNTILIKK
jgi:hypothetical protein